MVTMPVPPEASTSDMAYHQAFIRAMNAIESDDIPAKIYSAIDRAAVMTETSPAHLARLLVTYGLRAPRNAFPDSFIGYVDTYTKTLRDNPSLAMVQHHDIIELNDTWTAPVRSQSAVTAVA